MVQVNVWNIFRDGNRVNRLLYCVSIRLCFILQAREAVETRAQTEQKMAQKEKERKEDHLRQLATKAREERAGIRKVDGRSNFFISKLLLTSF